MWIRLAFPAWLTGHAAYGHTIVSGLLGVSYVLYAVAADQSTFSLIVGLAIAIAVGYITVSERAENSRRKQRQNDFKDLLEQIGHLEQQLAEQSAASIDNQDKMRVTLHDVNHKLHTMTLQREELHRELSETKRLLTQANLRITALTTEIGELTQRLAAHEGDCPGHAA